MDDTRNLEFDPVVEKLCAETLRAVKQKDWATVISNNIRLVRHRAQPVHYAQAAKTIENLTQQLNGL